MKANTRLVNHLFLFAFLLLTLTTCKKDNGVIVVLDDSSSADIVPGKTNLSAFEMSVLKIKSGTFQQESYILQIGGQAFDLIKTNDTTLLFLTPKLQAGSYKITGTIDNKAISLDIILNQSAPIQNPKEFSAGVLNQLYQNLDTLASQMSQDTLKIQTNLREVSEYYHSKFFAELNNFSTEEIENLSLFIQSNYSFLLPPKQLHKPVSEIFEETFDKTKKALNYDLFFLLYCDSMIRLCLENPFTFIMVPVFVTKYFWYFGWCYYDVWKLQQLKTIKTQIDQIIEAFNPKNTAIEFLNNSSKTIQLRSKYRNVNQNDVNGGNTTTKEICTQDSQVISSGMNANGTFLKDKPVSPIPVDMSGVLEELSSEYLPVHTNYLWIGNISNPKVTLTSMQNNGYDMNLSFSTTEIIDQEFSFNVVYTITGFPSTSTQVQAILKVDATGANSIEIFSGNDQTGPLGQQLTDPIKVLVRDVTGAPFEGTSVFFAANNEGTVSQSQVTTNSEGIASVSWTLGNNDTSQTVTVTAFKSDNTTPLQGSPVTFTAKASQGEPCPGIPTITDPRDGQVYSTVQIGSQCWLQKNMNYQTGNSWCYDNKTSNCSTYGRLYDWSTALGVCPSGWHLPDNAEWTTLTVFLGGESIAGGKMKEAGTAHWAGSNYNATNSSGFTALPGGNRDTHGYYNDITIAAYYWSSTEYTPERAFIHTLSCYDEKVSLGSYDKTDGGISARCVKD